MVEDSQPVASRVGIALDKLRIGAEIELLFCFGLLSVFR